MNVVATRGQRTQVNCPSKDFEGLCVEFLFREQLPQLKGHFRCLLSLEGTLEEHERLVGLPELLIDVG